MPYETDPAPVVTEFDIAMVPKAPGIPKAIKQSIMANSLK
jgi:hypothetical protein